MDKFWPILITMMLALLAVAIAYRIRPLHSLVFGRGSAKVNQLAKAAVEGTQTAVA